MNQPIPSGQPGNAIVKRRQMTNQALAAVKAQPLAINLRTPDNHDESEISLLTYWQILLKRKWVVISVLTTIVVVVLVKTLLTPSIFRSTATLQIDLETIKIIQTEGLTPAEGVGDRDYYQTQYELLKTRALAERVAGKMTPADVERVRQNLLPSAWSRLVGLLRGASAAPTEEEAVAEIDRDRLISFVQQRLVVDPYEIRVWSVSTLTAWSPHSRQPWRTPSLMHLLPRTSIVDSTRQRMPSTILRIDCSS